ncbi:hypothetical protein ASPWEDRAFT_24553 [Aspergillus wentii DTO 134E9]|uniref:MICOS complex subunit MIC12 n=1 Tax=Aspergillus wentii DTO 134E9 TaxID=1073089 RepID=A0A1L9RUT5_ASPWE|nr:uncharacterized protein ASPWEDRAFT_24553 [Aspergillus wentii DTO 134E9]KAI9928563.1 hypothetical protein MW887_001777 [Aspergillus wentii]OJJ38638.1 hypothetical protein ASPWEDRAFT_24553 [Aspergillus wentii DTO 134E9]
MGFFVGFASGFALTTSALYITIQVHRMNRIEQRKAIHEQVRALNWTASPTGAYDRRLAPKDFKRWDDEITKSSNPTINDIFKDRWNQEVKTLAKKANESRWEDVRDAAAEGWRAARRLVKRE